MLRLNRAKALAVVVCMTVSVSVSACASASTAAHPRPASTGSSSPTATTASAAPSQTGEAAPWCTSTELSLAGPLDGFGGITGEHELTFALRNTGSQDCSLEGYPTVQLYDPRPMPFAYDNAHPGGPFLSMAPPTRVALTAHGQAYFQVVKYRCDTGESSFATRLRITLPNAAGAFIVDLSPPMPPVRSLWWCTGQTHDPGNVVSISPIRQTARQLTP
jgi:hypothetical protein